GELDAGRRYRLNAEGAGGSRRIEQLHLGVHSIVTDAARIAGPTQVDEGIIVSHAELDPLRAVVRPPLPRRVQSRHTRYARQIALVVLQTDGIAEKTRRDAEQADALCPAHRHRRGRRTDVSARRSEVPKTERRILLK